jgi:DNA-binding GntR family transcriptional regulator
MTNSGSSRQTGAITGSRTASGSRELFKNKAYLILRNRLNSGQYKPGMHLSERQLAEDLGMSKTPVKAALERLEMERFIIVSPQSGIVVRRLTIEEMTEIYEIRVALEGFVLRSIVGRLTANQWEQWERNLAEYATLDSSDAMRHRAVELDAEFHLLPCEFLGNRLIIDTMQQFSSRMVHVISCVFSTVPTRISESIKEHRQIIEAVRQGDGDRARYLSERHLRIGYDILIEALRNQTTESSACL